jgi:hypothetical protein
MQQLSIAINTKTITLRPSLAAAVVLTAGGELQKTFRGVADLSLGHITNVIHASQHPAGELTKEQIADLLLADGLVKLSERSIELMTFMASLVEAGEDESEEEGATLPLTEYLEKLFSMGTGFVGWTPEATWSATPNEIMRAAKTRSEFWSSLFGGKSDKKAVYDETRDEDGIEDLRLLSNVRR